MATANLRSIRLDPATYQIDCRLDYTLDSDCDFIFMIHVAQTPRQRVLDESLRLSPAVRARLSHDPAGHRLLRLRAAPGPLVVDYRARVELWPMAATPQAEEWPIAQLPDVVLPDLLPTRYCEADRLGPAARQLFGAVEPGLPRVQAICDWLRRNIEYRVGSSLSTTTALDIFVQRAGVCRDFAHLGIAFCRALNIPARMVCGYASFDEPPPDFHAVFEAFLGGRWRLFDPTGLAPTDALVRIAHGRDAHDTAFATLYGMARLQAMSPQVRRVDLGAAATRREPQRVAA
ncbi:MAG: transglutaminase family protein [Rubrivivax sp.]|nr:transglutaminase family protein [Rubrivivax sp.]